MATTYSNFQSGTLTDNPLLIGATSANSSNFASLPVVAAPDTMWLVLDPDGVNGAPEMVQITAHTASATVCTIVRAQQSTTARAHPVNTAWRVAVTKSDLDELPFRKMTATGDLIYASAANAAARLAIGTTGGILRVTGGVPGWLAVGSANTVLRSDGTNPSWGQIVSADITDGTIVNADISASAAIAYSKLNLAGSLTYADLSTNAQTSLTGFRNTIINGDFSVWQRGTSFASPGYTADRFAGGGIGSTVTFTRQAFTPGNVISGQEPAYHFRAAVTSVAGAGNYAHVYHPVEDVRTFAGQTATLSFWAKADASKNMAVSLQQNFGTGGSPSTAITGIGATLVALTTSWQRFTVTVSVPSISGKTLGTNNDHTLIPTFWFDAGSTLNSQTASLGQQSGTFDIWGVQLEAGPSATPFERLPYADQLARCQRYYYRITPGSIGSVYGSGFATAATGAAFALNFPVAMRSTPTMSGTGTPGDYATYSNVGAVLTGTGGPTLQFASPNTAHVALLVAAGLAAGNGTMFIANNATSFLGFSAEI